MKSSTAIGVPTGEPKDGDFVAYLAEIERRQLAALPARATAGPNAGPTTGLTPSTTGGADEEDSDRVAPLTQAQAEELRRSLQDTKTKRSGSNTLVPAAIFAIFGLLLVVHGLADGGGIVPFLIGAVILWRVMLTFRRAASSSSQRDLAARLADTLRAASQQQRK